MAWIDILSALLTPLIAIVAAYIAYQQYRTGRQKVKLELFERRYAVYTAIHDYILEAISSATLSRSAIPQLNTLTHDAFFLFGEEVDDYIQSLREHGSRLMFTHERLADQDLPIGAERSTLAEENKNLLIWFSSQPRQAKKVVAKYMRLKL